MDTSYTLDNNFIQFNFILHYTNVSENHGYPGNHILSPRESSKVLGLKLLLLMIPDQ